MNQPAGIADLDARRRALDPARSFIVQAPAGSGKTELLIQRYLVLLSRVAQPEEIAAITFTRKAAAEMRKRVLEALAAAADEAPPAEPHRRLTWEHARAALERDRALGWRLQENAARLRIQTVDALCASLTRQMPVLAALGAQPESVEDASALYREAARATLTLLEEKGAVAQDVARLLAHLDNNVAVAGELLADMLARRDHWLRNLGGAREREALEAALAAVRRDAAERVRRLFHPFPLRDGGGEPADVESWQALAGELLTKEGTWRKKSALAQSLADRDDLREALFDLTRLPPARYSEEQWEALGAIARLLPFAVAELKLVFAARGQADFVEIAQGALAALGESDAPTDLLLALDYRIHHILVDEFQDTSFTQFELLEKLTAGWQPDDGRTLFLVGDPMQSIYRFREAEVGLFLRARSRGIGALRLEPLTLSVNFRSQAGIVEWVNRAFRQVMPREEDIAAGAVPYVHSDPLHPAQAEAVRVHAFFDGDAQAEAARVAGLAQAALAEGTVAILVRNRSHLREILPRLKQSGLRFRAIEIESLEHRPVVQDLLALARALAHPADRLAWLALLRAPWCGFMLADLHALAGDDPNAAVWELMHDAARLARLSTDGRARIERVRAALDAALRQRLRASLRDRVEGAWLALGGPACVEDDTDLDDADICLDYLERSEQAGEIADFAALEEGLAKLYALPDLHADERLQIMTIHKAKGLEFDSVIVPGLGGAPRRRDPSLFLWMERAGALAEGASTLLLAPIRQTGGGRDPIYDHLVRLDAHRQAHEDGRLLYVAATRAKKHLHLLGSTRLATAGAEIEPKAPSAGSLLERLWPVVEPEFIEAAAMSASLQENGEGAIGAGEAPLDQSLRRLPSDWTAPAPPAAVPWSPPQGRSVAGEDIEFSWAGETARHVGSVVHRWLQRIAEDALAGWDAARVASLRGNFRHELAALGVVADEQEGAAERVAAALANALADARGRWLLGPQPEAASEYRIRALIGGELRLLAIDRLFRDERGVRWIVDYKTGPHGGADREAFLDSERERYAAQLERYARALGEAGRARLGLYFPLLSGWREWQSGGEGNAQ